MKLFKYEGYALTIAEEAYLLQPFKTLWKRDKTRDKSIALQELGYIYFMEDPRSDYQIYIDREERDHQIRIGEGIKDKWKPDKAVLKAMEFYASFKSDAALLLEDMRTMVGKLREQLKEIDLTKEDDKGKPIYNIDSYSKIITDLAKLTRTIDETEKAVARDIIQSDKVRGAAEKAVFEDV